MSRFVRCFAPLLVCCLAGCPEKSTVQRPAELPLADQMVEILAPVDLALRESWEPLLEEWRAQTGGNVMWTEFPAENPPWRSGAELSTAPNGGRVVLVALPELGDAESQGFLTPLPASVVEQVDKKDILPGLKAAALSRQKRLVALPVSAPVLLCYYRKDLLEAAGRTPPQTWDEYQTLINDLPQWTPGLSAQEPCGPEFLASLFLARSAAYAKHPQNYSVWFDIQTGEPLFNSPAFEHALGDAREAWSQMPAEIWTATPADCRRELLAGRAAMILSFEPASAYPRPAAGLETEATATDPLPIGVCRLPGSRKIYQRDANRWAAITTADPHQPGLVGFSGLVMGATANSERSAAWNLLQLLAERTDAAFADRPRSVCRESESLTGFGSGELSAETESLLTDATAETLRRLDTVCDFSLPAAGPLRQIIAEELGSSAKTERESEVILTAIQGRLVQATQDRRDAIRDSYRRSVGLAPAKPATP